MVAGRAGPLAAPHRTEGQPRDTHSPRQEVALCLSFTPEVTGLLDICEGGALAGEQGGGGGERGTVGPESASAPPPQAPLRLPKPTTSSCLSLWREGQERWR